MFSRYSVATTPILPGRGCSTRDTILFLIVPVSKYSERIWMLRNLPRFVDGAESFAAYFRYSSPMAAE
ncbi:MAG: hypothetical protein ABFC28_07915 [Rikenellaceae bacterium]